jgi:hypothetical protein
MSLDRSDACQWENAMDILLTVHSIIRWVIIAVAIVAIVRFALVWVGRMAAGSADRRLMSAFSGLLDTQALLGLIYLVLSALGGGGLPRERIEHAITMILAIIVGHLPMRWRDAEGTIRARNNLLAIVVALILIYIGVARLPGGWTR